MKKIALTCIGIFTLFVMSNAQDGYLETATGEKVTHVFRNHVHTTYLRIPEFDDWDDLVFVTDKEELSSEEIISFNPDNQKLLFRPQSPNFTLYIYRERRGSIEYIEDFKFDTRLRPAIVSKLYVNSVDSNSRIQDHHGIDTIEFPEKFYIKIDIGEPYKGPLLQGYYFMVHEIRLATNVKGQKAYDRRIKVDSVDKNLFSFKLPPDFPERDLVDIVILRVKKYGKYGPSGKLWDCCMTFPIWNFRFKGS